MLKILWPEFHSNNSLLHIPNGLWMQVYSAAKLWQLGLLRVILLHDDISYIPSLLCNPAFELLYNNKLIDW